MALGWVNVSKEQQIQPFGLTDIKIAIHPPSGTGWTKFEPPSLQLQSDDEKPDTYLTFWLRTAVEPALTDIALCPDDSKDEFVQRGFNEREYKTESHNFYVGSCAKNKPFRQDGGSFCLMVRRRKPHKRAISVVGIYAVEMGKPYLRISQDG